LDWICWQHWVTADNIQNAVFEALIPVAMKGSISWHMMLYSPVKVNLNFGGKYRFEHGAKQEISMKQAASIAVRSYRSKRNREDH
jgi:hypothetical protein